MPDHPKPNVFAPEFLEQAFERDPPPITGPEATWAGPWKVELQGESFFVVRENGGEPVVVTECRETALLLAAVMPVVGRDPRYWIKRGKKPGNVRLKTARGKDVVTVARIRYEHRDLAESLNVAEYLLRTPTALAFLLEAAPFEALEQAGAVLARRMAAQQTPEGTSK